MKLTTCLVTATIAAMFAVSVHAQVDCTNWNTEAFFKAAKASDVTRCLAAGANPDEGDFGCLSPLNTAVLVGTAEVVKALLEAGADPDAPDADGFTPLHSAGYRGNVEAVTALLAAGADPNAQNALGETPLFVMLRDASAELVAVLLEAGADPNLPDKYGSTPLHSAAAKGLVEEVRALLEAGADPAARDKYGGTPLQLAADNKAVRVLLEAGTDPAALAAAVESITAPSSAQVVCPDWNTAAFFKAAKSSDVTSCLEAGAGLEMRDRWGDTPLLLATEVGNVEAVTTLVNAGADPNKRSGRNESALFAALNGTVETVKVLLQAGADPNAPSARDGITPLTFFAAWNKDAEKVKALLEAGADPNAWNPRGGGTPLHTAARRGTAEVVRALLEAGADPNATNGNRKTPWDLAKDREELKGSDVYRHLARAAPAHPQLNCAGWNTTAFFKVAEASEVTRCLEAGAHLNAGSPGGWMPVHVAAAYSQPAVIKTLLKAGVDPNARSEDGRSPLHMALGYDKFKVEDHNRDFEVVTTLLKAGADPNAASSGGSTPLHTAAFSGRPAVIEALVVAGADLKARTNDGTTPLHAAAFSGELSVIKALLLAGADLNPRTDDGSTPLHIAASNWTNSKIPEIVTELLNSGADPRARNEEGKSPWDLAQRNRTLKNTDAYRRLASASECPGWNRKSWFESAGFEQVKKCLAAGVDPNEIYPEGWTPLRTAIVSGKHPAFVRALLEAGADWDSSDARGNTPLVLAANRGNIEVVKALLEAGADPNVGNRFGYLLHSVVEQKRVEVVKALVLEDADLEVRDSHLETPLHTATIAGSVELVTTLLKAGADPNARNMICTTPLHYAAALWNPEAGLVLLAGGADPTLRDEEGDLPFDSVQDGIGDILHMQDEGFMRTPARGEGRVGGPLHADFYRKLLQARINQRFRPWTANPVPPVCREDDELWHFPDRVRRKRN